MKIIDVRPVDAYDGWKLKNESRGGHIKSSKSLPVKWTNYIDWIEIVNSKGISPEQKIIIYGYESESAMKVAERFLRNGFEDLVFTTILRTNGRKILNCRWKN